MMENSLIIGKGRHAYMLYVGTSSRNGRLDGLGHFEKNDFKVLVWLQPQPFTCMLYIGIHHNQEGCGNYVIGWAG